MTAFSFPFLFNLNNYYIYACSTGVFNPSTNNVLIIKEFNKSKNNKPRRLLHTEVHQTDVTERRNRGAEVEVPPRERPAEVRY